MEESFESMPPGIRKLSLLLCAVLQAGLAGTYDYHIGFVKGLGEDNMGELSNRPLEYDRSVFPPKVGFLPAGSSAGA